MTKLIFNTLRPRQNGRRFPDDIFKCIFFNENVCFSIMIFFFFLNIFILKFVPKGQIYNIPALVQIMACRRPGDKPLSEPMMVRLPTHICVTRPQWVKTFPLLPHDCLFHQLIIPSAQRSCWGYNTFTPSVCPSICLLVCLSVHPASRVHSVVPTVLVGSISYLYILSSNFRRCVACKVSCKILNFEFLAI